MDITPDIISYITSIQDIYGYLNLRWKINHSKMGMSIESRYITNTEKKFINKEHIVGFHLYQYSTLIAYSGIYKNHIFINCVFNPMTSINLGMLRDTITTNPLLTPNKPFQDIIFVLMD